jgi:hypothetical protein
MMKGALTIVAAKAFPEVERVHRGRKGWAKQTFPMVTSYALSHARAVLRHAPDLADQVLAAGRRSPAS